MSKDTTSTTGKTKAGQSALPTPEEVWQSIEDVLAAAGSIPRIETIPREAALGRVLAARVAATVDVPMADVSAMDGFALCGAPPADRSLPIVGTSAAGVPPDFLVAAGRAASIMTGAVVPAGADRVVPVEQTRVEGSGVTKESVLVDTDPGTGAHIRRRGEVIAAGETLFGAGHLLTSGALSVLASHGVGTVDVVRAPTVAVLATGDEVVPPESEPGPGQLRNSNSPFLLAAGRSLGLDFQSLGIAKDDRDDLAAKVRRGLEADVFLLCGGVSMGEYDFVEEILEGAGCRFLSDKVGIQPGKPLVVARRDTSGEGSAGAGWVFGLPGNPASVMVTFWLFVRPLLRRLMGHDDRFWHGALDAELAADLPGSKGRDRFLTAVIEVRGGRIYATPRPPVGSHDAGAYAHGTALVRVPPHSPPTPAGGACSVLPIG